MILVNNVNHKNMIVMWNFLKGYASEKSLNEKDINIFELLSLPFPPKYSSAIAYYTDPSQWSSLNIYVKCYMKTKEITGDPNTFRNCGRSASKYRSLGNWKEIINTVSGPVAAVNYLPNVIPDWNDTKTFELIKPAKFFMAEQKVKAIIRYKFHPHIDPCDDYCSDPHILGLFESIPTNWPKHIWTPWKKLPLAQVEQPLVQYDPIKLYSGAFFKHLEITPYWEGDQLNLKYPGKNNPTVIGKKITLKSQEINGEEVFLGEYEEIQDESRTPKIVGTLITQTVELNGELVCREGTIMEAPYFIINYTCDELTITRKIWNLRNLMSGNKILTQEVFRTNSLLRKEIEEKNLAYKEIQNYSNHLKDLVDEKTKKLVKTQKALIHKSTMAAITYLNIGMAHNLRNPIKAIEVMMTQLSEKVNKLLMDNKFISTFGIQEIDYPVLKNFIQDKFSGNYELKDIDTHEATKIGRDLKEKIIELNVGIKLTSFQARNLAKYGITIDDLTFLKPYLYKYSIDIIMKLLDYTYKIKYPTFGTKKKFAEAYRIINSTMDLTELAMKEDIEIDLNAEIEKIIEEHIDTFDNDSVTVIKELFTDLPKINIDNRILNQIYKNLISNALHALKGDFPIRKITFKTYVEKGKVIAEVSDTGKGIPEGNLSKIFLPFFSTKAEGEGKGIGLYAVHELIDPYGGIEVLSKNGETTFKLIIEIA